MPPHPQPESQKPSEDGPQLRSLVPLLGSCPKSAGLRRSAASTHWSQGRRLAESQPHCRKSNIRRDMGCIASDSGPTYGAHGARCWNPTEASNLQRSPEGCLLSATPCLACILSVLSTGTSVIALLLPSDDRNGTHVFSILQYSFLHTQYESLLMRIDSLAFHTSRVLLWRHSRVAPHLTDPRSSKKHYSSVAWPDPGLFALIFSPLFFFSLSIHSSFVLLTDDFFSA
ncbi:hypothetical protein J3E69DRAFT_191173 [Trichoderma sp. SZMC 28015]